MPFEDLLGSINTSTVNDILVEYLYLSRLESWTNAQEERYGSILELALENSSIDLLIGEMDHILAHESKDIDIEKIKDYQAFLRERLGTQTLEGTCSINRNLVSNKC